MTVDPASSPRGGQGSPIPNPSVPGSGQASPIPNPNVPGGSGQASPIPSPNPNDVPMNDPIPDLKVPRLINATKKMCHFNTSVRMLLYQQNESTLGPPGLIANPQDRFVEEYQRFRTQFTSSQQLGDLTTLFRAFCQCYLPHLNVEDLLKEDQGVEWLFQGLMGNSRPTQAVPRVINRCRYFAPVQPVIRTTMTAHDPSQFSPPAITSTEAFLTIRLPQTLPPNTTLSGLIETHFRDGFVDVRHTTKEELVFACDGLPVFVYWVPPAPVVDPTQPSGSSLQPPRRPSFNLGGDVLIHTREDGPALYRLCAGGLHSG